MKKFIAIVAFFAAVTVANAQQFGLKGGLTLSTINGADTPKDNKAMVLYEAGVLYKADLGAGFAIQPALAYQVKGANLNQRNKVESKTGFVELSVGAQWGPDLLAFRPYIFVEPYLGYALTGKETLTTFKPDGTPVTDEKKINGSLQKDAKNKLEYGAGAGIGLEIASHVQISCQLFRNFGKLYKEDVLDNDEYGLRSINASYKNLKSYQGVKFTLAILF